MLLLSQEQVILAKLTYWYMFLQTLDTQLNKKNMTEYDRLKQISKEVPFKIWLEQNGWQEYDGWDRFINLNQGRILKGIGELYNAFSKSTK